ncbi:MAG: WD40 repeat domain-containing protein [Planctomycetes bacterium]|nr:WD40 repeat domain-containing protein [Planctomycetota bacterium]
MKRPQWLLLILLTLLLLGGGGAFVYLQWLGPAGAANRTSQQGDNELPILDVESGSKPNSLPGQQLDVGQRANNGSGRSNGEPDKTETSTDAGTDSTKATDTPDSDSDTNKNPKPEENVSPDVDPAKTGRQPVAQIGGTGRVGERWSLCLDMNTNGSLAATFGPDHVTLWSPDSDEPLWSEPCEAGFRPPGEFSPDDAHLVCATGEGHVALRKVADGELVWEYEHATRAAGACFQPDGQHLFVAFNDGDVVELDATDGTLTRKLAHLDDTPECLTYEPLQKLLVVCAENAVFTIDFSGTVKLVCDEEGLTGKIQLSTDGRNFFFTTIEGVLQLRRLSDGTVLKEFNPGPGEDQRVIPPVGAGEGRLLLRVQNEVGMSLQLWDSAAFKATATYEAGFIVGLGASPDGRRAVTSDMTRNVRFWSLEDGKIAPLDNERVTPIYAEWMPDGRRILVGDQSGRVAILDADTLIEGEGFQAAKKSVDGMLLSPQGDKLLVIDSAREPTLWDLATRESVSLGKKAATEMMQFSPDGSKLYLAVDEKLVAFNTVDGSIDSVLYDDWNVSGFRVSPDGTRILLIGKDARIFPLPVSGEGELVVEKIGDFGYPEFSPDGSVLAVGTSGFLYLWDVGRGEISRSFEGSAYLLKFNHVGDELIAANYNGEAHRVKVDGTLHEKLGGTPELPASISWSPDGQRLLITGYDHTVKIWNLTD